MARYVPLTEAELNNDSSIFSSVAAGFASGLLKTVEGVVSLGAELIDLGADTNKAAEVEQFFDNINIFEDTAQDRVAGKLVEVFTQIGIPGTAGFKAATKLADKAIKAKKSGNYVNTRAKSIQDGMKTAQSLNERIPDAKPAATDENMLLSLFSSASDNGTYFAKVYSLIVESYSKI